MTVNLNNLKQFLLCHTANNPYFSCVSNELNLEILERAFELTCRDVMFHYPKMEKGCVLEQIISNCNELPIFLYRLGRLVYLNNPQSASLKALHLILRSLCSCEIYFSTDIDEGFYVVHGVGTVIGSRFKIGKGFVVYQGCTVGHLKDKEEGGVIGDYVTVYANASILGHRRIGSYIKVGAHALVLKDVPDFSICRGSPAFFYYSEEMHMFANGLNRL